MGWIGISGLYGADHRLGAASASNEIVCFSFFHSSLCPELWRKSTNETNFHPLDIPFIEGICLSVSIIVFEWSPRFKDTKWWRVWDWWLQYSSRDEYWSKSSVSLIDSHYGGSLHYISGLIHIDSTPFITVTKVYVSKVFRFFTKFRIKNINNVWWKCNFF